MGSRLLTPIRSTRRDCWIRAMSRSFSLGAGAIIHVRSRWQYTVSRMSFCSATMVRVVFREECTAVTDWGSVEFAFYTNRGGRRSRKNFLVHWEGAPTSFGEFRRTFSLTTSHARPFSIPIPIRTGIRAHICRDPQRRNRLNVPSHPRQQPPPLIHRHTAFTTTGLSSHVPQLAVVV